MGSREKLKAIKDYFWNDQEPKYNAHQYFEDIDYDLLTYEAIKNCVLTFDEYSGVPASLVLKKIRELISDEKKRK